MLAVVLLSAAALAVAGCGTSKSHALEYVVLPNGKNGDAERPPSAELLKQDAEVNGEDQYPIYGDDPPPRPGQGTGGAGCTVGLIGARCERGLLEDVVPLDEREPLDIEARLNGDRLNQRLRRQPARSHPARSGSGFGSPRTPFSMASSKA